jgi:CBS domain containing-hemolysin-like protein
MVSETFLPAWNWFLAETHMVTAAMSKAIQLFAETMAASLFILLFGEFGPKALFRAKSNSLLSFFALTMDFLNKLLYPIAAFFALSPNGS